MKLNIKILTILAAVLLCSYSCNYLDIVPDEAATEADAFADRYAAERYLYSCYSFLPKERQNTFMANTTEIVTMLGEMDYLQGKYSATSPGDYAFWSGHYGAIRRCYLLLENIDSVPRLDEEEKEIFKAEVRFLIAYYHFQLMRAYGPIPIITKAYPLDTEIADFPARSDIDYCVQWISDMYDNAYLLLPETQNVSNYGRATKPAAKAMKAKLWMYAASPLFNGNSEFYGDKLIDPVSGKHLIPQTYDVTKWEKTLEYALEAEASATKNGISLYKGSPTPDEGLSYPDDITQWRARMNYIDKKSNEMIWADTRHESMYDFQNNATPRDPAIGGGNSWSNLGLTLDVIKRFYTKNGLPIEADPAYFTPAQYYQIGQYEGENTANLHLDREPRFYAWVSFHNGWYEMQRTVSGVDLQRIRTMYRGKDIHGINGTNRDYSLTGYLPKKNVSPAYSTKNGFPNFSFPIIRLGELYLIIAEAAAESGDLTTAKTYLNKIRTQAGIPSVEDSWEGIATLNQAKLIEIIRRERMIELFMEGHLGWDLKRWKQAGQIMNTEPKGMNINGETDAAFFAETEVSAGWSFITPNSYLLPIPQKDVNIITSLIQNPGY